MENEKELLVNLDRRLISVLDEFHKDLSRIGAEQPEAKVTLQLMTTRRRWLTKIREINLKEFKKADIEYKEGKVVFPFWDSLDGYSVMFKEEFMCYVWNHKDQWQCARYGVDPSGGCVGFSRDEAVYEYMELNGIKVLG